MYTSHRLLQYQIASNRLSWIQFHTCIYCDIGYSFRNAISTEWLNQSVSSVWYGQAFYACIRCIVITTQAIPNCVYDDWLCVRMYMCVWCVCIKIGDDSILIGSSASTPHRTQALTSAALFPIDWSPTQFACALCCMHLLAMIISI